jgi:hypothetical protein
LHFSKKFFCFFPQPLNQSQHREASNQKSKIETMHFVQIVEFLDDYKLDPEIMLNAIKKEEQTAKSRILALQEITSLIGDGFMEKLTKMSSRAFLAAVFGLIQNPLSQNTLQCRLSHYYEGIENARPTLKAQISKLWKEITMKLTDKITDKSAASVYSLCGISLKWQKTVEGEILLKFNFLFEVGSKNLACTVRVAPESTFEKQNSFYIYVLAVHHF